MDRSLRTLFLLAVALICLPLAGAAPDADGGDRSADVPSGADADDVMYSPDRLFVRGDASLLDGMIGYDSAVPAWKGSQWSLVTLSGGEDAGEAERVLKDSGLFSGVQRERMFALQTQSTGASASGWSEDRHLETMGVPEAWDHLESMGKPRYGSPDVIVAVIDTGTDIGHEALKDRIWTNEGEVPDNGIDDDGNGYVDDVHGWNFSLDEPDVNDTSFHGTHVSGIIAASPDGPCPGVAPGCTVMPLPAIVGFGYVYEGTIIEAAEYARDNGASIINMSFGYDAYTEVTAEFLEELSGDCLIVSAAGNEGCCVNLQHAPYHSCYRDPKASVFGILSVMSVGQNGTDMDSYSNYDDIPYGECEYDTFAVGSDILSTVPGGYESLSGTSMACPVVAGMAALLLSADPSMTPQELSAAICLSGDVHPFNPTIEETDALHTLCNAADAMTLERVPDLGPYTDRMSCAGTEDLVAGEECTFAVDLMNRGFDAYDVMCTLTSDDPYVEIIDGSARFGDVPSTSTARAPGAFVFKVSGDCPADHWIELIITISSAGADDAVFGSQFPVCREMRLPAVISEDTVFDPSYDYVLDRDVTVEAGTEVLFGGGCIITAQEKEDGTMPVLTVSGTVRFAGTSDGWVTLTSSGGAARIVTADPSAEAALEFCDVSGFLFGGAEGVCDFRDCRVVYDLYGADDSVLRIGSALDSSFTGSVREVLIGEMEGSLLVTDDVDAVRMDADGSLYRTQVAVRPCGHHTDFHLSGNVTESVFVPLCHGAEETVTFSAAEGIAYSDVHFGGCLERLSPFAENSRWQDLPAESIWPFVTDVHLIDGDRNRLGDVIGNTVCALVMEFSRPVETSLAVKAEFIYAEDGKVRIESIGMPAPDTWMGYVPVSDTATDLTMVLDANGWYAEDGSCLDVPALKGALPVHLDAAANERTEVRAYQTDAGAKVTWSPAEPYHILGFNVYRYDSPDAEPVLIGNRPFLSLDAKPYLIDGTAQVGRTYWYAVKAVGPEGESVMSQRAEVRMHDTHAPVITPEIRKDCMEGKDLELRFTVTDDAELTGVMLKYRQTGTYKWQIASLASDGDRYTATIPGEQVKGDGIEYYIWASDSENFAFCGDSEHPIVCPLVSTDGTSIGLAALALVFLATVPLLFLRRN